MNEMQDRVVGFEIDTVPIHLPGADVPIETIWRLRTVSRRGVKSGWTSFNNSNQVRNAMENRLGLEVR